ncbi:MAG TPA: hypothetical protein VMU87_02445 [Stellaceae bacterium]|nr:hypothetical protein [Stellaceae bacterium]
MIIPSRTNVAQVVAALVSRRTTKSEELSELMQCVHRALQDLDQAAEPPSIAPVYEAEVGIEPHRSTPRRRRVAIAVHPPEVEEVEAAAAPAPRLLRRADVVPASAPSEPLMLTAPPTGTLRGIVKWFDLRTRRAALQLPGISGDVLIESALLDQMGIPRLYRGQEVEATLAAGEIPRVVRLALPGGAWQINAAGGIVHGRQAKPVVVELKREALRRVAARAEAELVLGPGRQR